MAMPEEPSFRVQTEELCMTVSRLATVIGEIREAFVRQKTLPDENVAKQLHDLLEEIAFTAVREDEQMIGVPMRIRRPSLRYQSILTHLQIVTSAMISLISELEKQFGRKLPLSGLAVEQTDTLFTHQGMILCTIEEAIRTGDQGHLRTACRACSEFASLCRQSSTEHEKCFSRGLCCLLDSALFFLKILDLMRSLVHHEREIIKLLVRWRRTGQNRSV